MGIGDWSKVGSCCYQCEERHPACHDTCATYLQQKAEYIERQRMIKEAKRKERLFDDYHAEKTYKAKRRRED